MRVAYMRTPAEVALVIHLAAEGLNKCEIARVSGIPRGTVRTWLAGEIPDFERKLTYLPHLYWSSCPVCAGEPDTLPRAAYVYLLGLYLGDGCLAQHPRTYKLRIFCADAYPGLMRLCEEAISEVLPTTRVGRVQKEGCSEITSYSKHWICLFPQHGPGMKHTRKIELADWQQALVDVDPRPLVRGLIHSDGCRVLNRAYGTHYPPYPRYEFTNESAGIRRIFERACDAIGVEWRYNKPNTISVAKRASVAILDSFIGPKS
jgi:hypothetical protein